MLKMAQRSTKIPKNARSGPRWGGIPKFFGIFDLAIGFLGSKNITYHSSCPFRVLELSFCGHYHAMVGKRVGGVVGLVGSLIILLIVVKRNMEAVERILRQTNQLFTTLTKVFRTPQSPPLLLAMNMTDEERAVAEWNQRLAASALRCHLYSDVATCVARQEYV